jgi:hypothetical protein
MNAVRISRGLGWFSIGLGLTQILAPRQLSRLIGVGDRQPVMRAMGARELAHGAAILTWPRAGASVWTRVAGDALDLGLLGSAFASRNVNRARVAAAAAMVLGVAVVDFLTARRLIS